MLNLAIHNPSRPTLLRHPLTQTLLSGAGIFNLLPIAYSNWPRLRVSTNPEWMNRSHGNLRLSANRNFTYFFVTYTNMLSSLIHDTCPYGQACIYQRTLPYPYIKIEILTQVIASVIRLSPVLFSVQKHLTSELLRFL